MASRRNEYDSEWFREAWFSKAPMREIAEALGVSIVSVWLAARRRGFPARLDVRGY